MTQDDINTFAELTGDRQWIHTDPERAKSGPFGTTVAHGYFTLSLASKFLWEIFDVPDAGMVINYGINRARFPAPVLAGSQVRMGLEVASVDDVAGGKQAVYSLTFEIEGGKKPCCVAEIVFRYYEDNA